MLHPIGTPRQINYNILDIIQEYAPRSYKQTSNPRSKYLMQCPLHDDRQRHDSSGSFSINADGSLFLCFGCGAKGNAYQLRQLLSNEISFSASNEGHRVASSVRPSKTPKPARPLPTRPPLQGVTVAQIASAKGLDPDYLRDDLSWRDHSYYGTPAIAIPYPDENNGDTQTRYRVGRDTGDRFRWEKGARPRLYGLWNLPQIKDRNFVVLVEGETDYATLDYHGFPVLAGPGAQNFKKEWAQQLEGIERVYAWQEPDTGGDLFVRRLAESIPNLLIITPPEGIKDANELADQAGAGFSDFMDELIADAEPPPPPFLEYEIRTSFLTNPEMKGNNLGFVINDYMDRQRGTLCEALRQGHAREKDTFLADRIEGCYTHYVFKKCLNTGEVAALRFKCGDSNCHFCRTWLLREFLGSKEEVLKANLKNPSIYRIYLFSQRLHEDIVDKAKDIADIQKSMRQMLTRLTDSLGNSYQLAKDHLYGLRMRMVGNIAHFEIVLLGEHQSKENGIDMLEAHFRRQTGVESVVTEDRCHGLKHAQEIFTTLMAVPADWDTADNYLCWKGGTKGSKMVQGKGVFYRVSGGAKGAKKTPEQLAQTIGYECRICGFCTPLTVGGRQPVAATRVREVTSPITGFVYLEPIDYVDELYGNMAAD